MNKTFLLTISLACGLVFSADAQKKPKTKVKVKTEAGVQAVPANATDVKAVVAETTAELKAAINQKQALRYAKESITEADLERHLRILASDEYEGRETGEKGQKMAAEYIAAHFKSLGLQGPVKDSPNPYYQVFKLEKASWGDTYIKTDGQNFTFLEDFYVLGNRTPFQEAKTTEVVFAGYGIDDKKYSDYSKLNVKGKTVLVLAGEPQNNQKKSLVTGTTQPSEWATNWQRKVQAARNQGAAGVLFITDSDSNFKNTLNRLKHRLEKPSMGFRSEEKAEENGVIFISPTVAQSLLGTTESNLQKYKAAVAKTGRPASLKSKPVKNISIRTERKTETVETENVLGYLEGTDKKDELLVITAHYDHVGIIDGEIYNGADDDGTGTVALLEMAEAFAQAKKEGFGPRRSILFMPVTGEEKGLLGSEYYAANPVFPLDATIANLNIDMIGRTDEKHEGNKNYVYVIGADKLSTDLHNISEEVNKNYVNLELDYTYNDENDPNRFYYRSDHYNFVKNGVPAIFYFSGVHEDYHKPGDDVDKIMFDKTDKISDLVFLTAWELANRDERPKVDKKVK